MRVAQGMRSHPGITDAQPLAVPFKQFHQCMMPQGLVSPVALTTDKEDMGNGGIGRSLLHHIGTDGQQGFWFIQIHDPLASGLGANSLWMIIAIANDHSPAPILNILQVQVENFTWAKSALKH